MSTPHVAVLHLCTSRPKNPRFQLELDALNDSTIRQIHAMGWSAELVPCSERLVTAIKNTVSRADIVVIMGGEDVHPHFYGGPSAYQDQGDHEPLSDRIQIEIIKECARSGKPLLGICRGQQLINVAFGGTLTQHLPTSAIHRGERQGLGPFVRHPVRLTTEGVAEFGEYGAIKDGEIVYSTHHQAIAELGLGLEVVAVAPDGVIEAVRSKVAPILGVQWHPEHPDVITLAIERLLSYLSVHVVAEEGALR